MLPWRKYTLNKFDDGVPKDVIREIEALKWLKGNPNIVTLKCVFLEEDAIVLVLEYLDCDLYDIMRSYQEKELDSEQRENWKRDIMRIMFMLVCFLPFKS